MGTIGHTFNSAEIGMHSRHWIERLARWGYAAKGFVYVLLGILAVMAAVGRGKQNASKQGVAELIFEQPFGQFLAVLVVIGIIGFVVWRFVQAAQDTDGTTKEKRAIKKARYVVSGLVYLAFAVSLIRMIAGSGSGGGNRQQWIGRLLETDAGPFLVAVAGVITIISGVYQWVRAYKDDFMKRLSVGGLRMDLREWVRKIGKIGYAARGVVWLIIGFFLVRAGLTSNASEAKGSDGAFDTIQQSFGSWVLFIVAIGVVAYGVFMFVKAKYYQVRV